MIEAWWRSLKHQWLFLHPLDTVATIRRLVAFYVDQHNCVLPHSAFRGQTPDEMYFGTGDAVPEDLASRAAAARHTRLEANRATTCETCRRFMRPPDDRRLMTIHENRRWRASGNDGEESRIGAIALFLRAALVASSQLLSVDSDTQG